MPHPNMSRHFGPYTAEPSPTCPLFCALQAIKHGETLYVSGQVPLVPGVSYLPLKPGL